MSAEGGRKGEKRRKVGLGDRRGRDMGRREERLDGVRNRGE